jgi:hypothetical protein
VDKRGETLRRAEFSHNQLNIWRTASGRAANPRQFLSIFKVRQARHEIALSMPPSHHDSPHIIQIDSLGVRPPSSVWRRGGMWNPSDVDSEASQPVRLSAGSGEGFMSDLEAACRLLGTMHLRCSLFMIRPSGIPVRTAVGRLVPKLEAFGPVGILANGDIAFLHLDRCLIQERGDSMIEAQVKHTIDEALVPGRAARVLSLHYWTDELADPSDLLRRVEDGLSRAGEHIYRLVASVP